MKYFLVFIMLMMAGCSNENLNHQLSQASSRANEINGVILYSGFSFQLHMIEIDGVKYIANTKGGLVKVD